MINANHPLVKRMTRESYTSAAQRTAESIYAYCTNDDASFRFELLKAAPIVENEKGRALRVESTLAAFNTANEALDAAIAAGICEGDATLLTFKYTEYTCSIDSANRPVNGRILNGRWVYTKRTDFSRPDCIEKAINNYNRIHGVSRNARVADARVAYDKALEALKGINNETVKAYLKALEEVEAAKAAAREETNNKKKEQLDGLFG